MSVLQWGMGGMDNGVFITAITRCITATFTKIKMISFLLCAFMIFNVAIINMYFVIKRKYKIKLEIERIYSNGEQC